MWLYMSENKINQFLNGFVLIDVPAGALNMQGGKGDSKNNEFPYSEIKKVQTKHGEVPYVSGQAWKYWIRNNLSSMGWNMSKMKKESKQVSTECNPVKNDDDDLFGYGCKGRIKSNRTV
jgi:CRISPR/Cas system-associated protein Cas7 (RAMP superfamily)